MDILLNFYLFHRHNLLEENALIGHFKEIPRPAPLGLCREPSKSLIPYPKTYSSKVFLDSYEGRPR